jgi:dTDP-4-amino-4,6-dideoxygalactose transaminase
MIHLIKPDVTFDEVADDIRAIIASGMLTRGPYVRDFEQRVADYAGAKHAFATTSATTALHLSLIAAEIGAGDEVLVSDFTFPASGNAIVQAGATPVMVDCLPGRFDLDPADAKKKVTPRTRAIMPIDPFGQPAELDAVHAVAREHGLIVIEDAACALGARRGNIRCGARPGLTCFSFHPRKVPTTGEGGMITTDDDTLAERIAVLRNHGGVQQGISFAFVENGFNYRLSEIPAALGVAQMKRLDAILADRRATALKYHPRLEAIPGVTLPLSADADCCTFQSLVVMLDDGIDRNAVVAKLRALEVESTLGTYAMHSHPAFSRFGYAAGDLPNAWRAQQQTLTLPLLPQMSDENIDKVVTSLAGSLVPH